MLNYPTKTPDISHLIVLEVWGSRSLRLRQLNLALRIVNNLTSLDAAQVVVALAERGIVVEEVPLLLVLHNRVMCRPSNNWLEDTASICEGTVWAVANSVAEEVGIAGRVREVVLAVVLVCPRRLEETPVMVVCNDGLAGLWGEYLDLANRLGKLVHVLRELGYPWAESVDVGALGLHLAVVLQLELASSPALELTTPETTKVAVSLSILVDQDRGVNAVAALDGLGVRLEGTLRAVSLRNTNPHDTLLVSGREVEVVFAILLRRIRSPHLLSDPWNVLGREDTAVVHDLALNAVGEGEDVVVLHGVLVAIVIVLNVGGDVVGGIDVELAVEDVSRGVGRVDVSDEGLLVRHDCR